MRCNFVQSGRKDNRSGVALAITLVVLVSLAVITTILSLRVAQVRQRQQYIMDYQKARYGADSALKYIFNVLPEQAISYADRQDAADFSDLFWMSKPDYLTYLDAWAAAATDEQLQKYIKEPEEQESSKRGGDSLFSGLISKMMGSDDSNEPNTAGDTESVLYVDPNQIIVPGPYGPAWPNVVEPMELEVGDCKITITVEDENAKMPLSWLITDNIDANKQARAALDTFAEWMLIAPETVEQLVLQLNELGRHKLFQLNPSTVLLPAKSNSPQQSGQQPSRFSTSRTRSRRTRTKQPAAQAAKQEVRPPAGHAADFAKLFHSSLLDIDALSIPLPEMAFDDESPMKYLAVWGSQRVNVNTAPRHVLEAAFYFGGNASEIADRIIRARREEPFKSVEDLRSKLYGDTASLDRAAPYLDVQSNCFLIKVISRCGNARVLAAAAVIKEKKTVERLVVLYGR
jgi:type II secretory pathway component PulK